MDELLDKIKAAIIAGKPLHVEFNVWDEGWILSMTKKKED